MTSSFSASCLRSARTSASSSRVRRLSRFWRSACLPCLHTRGLQPAAQCVDADTKFLGNLCARTALFCHHPDGSGLERLVVPGRRYPVFAFVFHFLYPLSIITNAFLSINSGKGAGKLTKAPRIPTTSIPSRQTCPTEILPSHSRIRHGLATLPMFPQTRAGCIWPR